MCHNMKQYLSYGLLICFCVGVNSKESLLRVCYYSPPTPAPSQLNATLCTHLIAGFAVVQNGLVDLGNDALRRGFWQTTRLKETHPHLKVLLSIGGGGNNDAFSPALSSFQNRTRLVASLLTVLKTFDFDGLDVDWEFPVWNDNKPQDKDNFVAFLRDFKLAAAVDDAGGGKSLLLSVAVGAPKPIIDAAYDIPQMAKFVDFINLMSYDYHDFFWYTPFTGHNSPLFSRSVEKAYFATLNTAWSASYLQERGMPRNKIMVGIPIYGHSYRLLDPKDKGIDAPATGIGIKGGDLNFPEICEFLSSGATRVFDNESQVPYAYRDLDWVSYEDQESLQKKAKWIKDQGFGGAMTYNLNSDDWSGSYSPLPFPLHNVLFQVFNE